MIVLFTDFGAADIYVGQIKAVFAQYAPIVPVIDLLHNAPDFDIESSAHLLAALHTKFVPGSVFFCVIDPGVGGARHAVVMVADGYWFIGPDNGLLSVIVARSQAVLCWRITWRPEQLSSSFHGRDLFAPIAAWIALGQFPAEKLSAIDALQVQTKGADISRIIYIDHYGNCLTGLRRSNVNGSIVLYLAEMPIQCRKTFCEAKPGDAFWFENSVGLVEIAINLGNAAQVLGLKIGDAITKLK